MLKVGSNAKTIKCLGQVIYLQHNFDLFNISQLFYEDFNYLIYIIMTLTHQTNQIREISFANFYFCDICSTVTIYGKVSTITVAFNSNLP